MPARQFLAPCRGLLFPLAGRIVFRPGLRLFFPYCLFLLALQRGCAGGFNVPQFVEGIVSAEKSLNLVRPRALDLAVKAVNLASMVDDDIAAGIAISQVIALFLKRLDESVRVFVVFLPNGCDRLCALFLRYAGAFLLLFFLIVGFFVLVAAAVLPHSGRQGETVIAGELPRDGLQLEPVMVNVDGLGGIGIDARPDGVAVLPAVLGVEHDGARLPYQIQAAFCSRDEIEVLFAGEVVFGQVRVDGQGIEKFAAFRRLRLRVPFVKGAVEVLRHSAAQVQHFDMVVVELVEQMCGELTAAAPLIALRDHTRNIEYRRLTDG